MKIKVDLCITPGGNRSPESNSRIVGFVDVPKGSLYAILAAILSGRTHSIADGFNAAGDLLEKIEKEVA